VADKQVKFSVTADRESFRLVKAMVEDLKRSVESLAKAASSVNFGGMQSGGVTARRADRSIAGGSLGVPRPGSSFPGAKGGGVVQSVLGIGDAGELRQLLAGTKQAFTQIQSDVRSFVDHAAGDLKRLRDAISGVSTAAGTTNVPSGSSYVWGQGVTAKPGPQAPQPNKVPGAGGPSVIGGFGQVGQAALGQVGLGWAGNGISALGAGSAGAMIGGLGVAAIAGGVFATNARQSNLVANLDYGVNAPISFATGLAGGAGVARGMYGAARGRDMHRILAYQTAMQDRPAIEAVMRVDAQKELAKRRAEIEGATVGVVGKKIRSFVGGAPLDFFPDSWKSGSFGFLFKPAIDTVDPTVATARRDAVKIEEERINRALPGQINAAIEERAQADMATQGRFADVAQYAASAWHGNLATRRLGRMGPGRRPDGTIMDPAEWALQYGAGLERRGRTLEEVAGARRSIMSGAGVGYLRAGFGAESLISAQEGGAFGIESIVRAAGMLGGSARAGVRQGFGGLQSSIGAGGLDELAGSELFNTLYQRSLGLGSQFGYGGNAASRFVGSAAGLVYGGGQDVAEQQANSAMLGRGLGEWAAMTSGKTAPLYQAFGVLSSMKAAGGFGALSEKLRETDPSVLSAVARGAKPPAWMESMLAPGQSAQAVASSFLRQDRMAPFFESYGAMAPAAGSPAAAMLAKVRAAEAGGGSFVDVVKGELRGLKGAARGRRLGEVNQILGTTAVGGAEALYAREVADSDLAPFLSARGAHGQGPMGTERAAASAGAAQKDADAALFKNGGAGKIGELIKSTTATGAAGEDMLKTIRGLQGAGFVAGMQAAEGELKAFVSGLRAATQALQALGDGPRRGR